MAFPIQDIMKSIQCEKFFDCGLRHAGTLQVYMVIEDKVPAVTVLWPYASFIDI